MNATFIRSQPRCRQVRICFKKNEFHGPPAPVNWCQSQCTGYSYILAGIVSSYVATESRTPVNKLSKTFSGFQSGREELIAITSGTSIYEAYKQ